MIGRTHFALASELNGTAAPAGAVLRAAANYYYASARVGPF
jgi:hypothetical protein